jgi:hypothetical protein
MASKKPLSCSASIFFILMTSKVTGYTEDLGMLGTSLLSRTAGLSATILIQIIARKAWFQ